MADLKPVICSGYLLKRGHIVPSWRRRYFELLENKLKYKADPTDFVGRGEFCITKTTSVKESNLKPFCFMIIDEVENRDILLVAENDNDLTVWIEAVQEAISSQTFRSTPKPLGSGGPHFGRSVSNLFADTMEEGQMTIRIVRARNLAAKSDGGKTANPYCTIKFGPNSVKTATIINEVNPVWNQSFSFSIDRSYRFAKLEVWNEDTGLNDRFLGCVFIPLYMIGPEKRNVRWWPLGKRSHRSHINGDIYVEISTKLELDAVAVDILKDMALLPEMSLFPFSVDSANIPCSNSSTDIWADNLPGEILEDIALHVSLKTEASGEAFYTSGVLLLSNYRILFVAGSRLKEEFIPLDESNGITTYVLIGSIIQVSIAEEPDYLNSNVDIETVRIRTSDSRTLSFLFRDTLYVSTVPSAGESSLLSKSIDWAGGYIRPAPGDTVTVRRSVNPRKDTALLDNLKGLFNRNNVSTAKDRSASLAVFSRRLNGADLSTIERSFVPMLENNFGSDVFEDDIFYLEASDSIEGPPAKRIYERLNWRVLNRNLESMQAQTLFNAVMLSNKISSSAIDPLDDLSEKSFDKSLNTDQDSSSIDELIAVRKHEIAVLGIRSYAPVNGDDVSGWGIYDTLLEYHRISIPDDAWRISIANSNNYSMCDTYPALVAVPSMVEDETIMSSAAFRSRGRIPSLSWRHPSNHTSLTRCSQPQVGIGHKRCTEDESLLLAINSSRRYPGGSRKASVDQDGGDTAQKDRSNSQPTVRKLSTSGNKPLIIMDARPKINAQANQAAGKGFELSSNYRNCRVHFLEIANIHAVRSSLDNLEELCNDIGVSDSSWLKNVEITGWLTHLRRILVGACRIVHCMQKEKLSVLVHCSDGWDRTAQLTSLSMLMMDPYYRTIDGFMVLIEKEWFSFGHKFTDRLGFLDEGWASNERSPIFQQFIDCVYQILRQTPNAFEFNEDFLICILRCIQSGLFGNVYANCEKDRFKFRHNTMSVWSVVFAHRDAFSNPLYVQRAQACILVASAKNIVVWHRWFLSWHDATWKLLWSAQMEDLLAPDETLVDSIMVPTAWVDDNAVKSCSESSCGREFTIYRRRHHCRSCGLIYCERCTEYRRIVRSVSLTVLSRCCRSCAGQIDMAQRFQGKDKSRPLMSDDTPIRLHRTSEKEAEEPEDPGLFNSPIENVTGDKDKNDPSSLPDASEVNASDNHSGQSISPSVVKTKRKSEIMNSMIAKFENNAGKGAGRSDSVNSSVAPNMKSASSSSNAMKASEELALPNDRSDSSSLRNETLDVQSAVSHVKGNTAEIVKVINSLRESPSSFVKELELHLSTFVDDLVYEREAKGQKIHIRTNEGRVAVLSAIEFLRNQESISCMEGSAFLEKATSDHARDMHSNKVAGHDGSDGSSVASRVERYASWSGSMAEIIDFGFNSSATDVVVSLLVCDGVPSRGYRSNLLDPNFKFIGSSIGPHNDFGHFSVIKLAGDVKGLDTIFQEDVTISTKDVQMPPDFEQIVKSIPIPQVLGDVQRELASGNMVEIDYSFSRKTAEIRFISRASKRVMKVKWGQAASAPAPHSGSM